jgi:flagellar protein FlbD
MISLHRFGHRHEAFLLNPDLIASVEAHPDTVVTLTTGTRVIVGETPAEVAGAIRAWRAGILADVPGAALLTEDETLKSPPLRSMNGKTDAEAEDARFAGLVVQ